MTDFVINGFLVEKPPSLLERIALPIDDEMAIPRVVDGVVHQKLFVYKKNNGYWGIQVRDMIKSDIGCDFDSHKDALYIAYDLLKWRN